MASTREILRLYYEEKLSMRQIAEKLNCTHGVVQSRIYSVGKGTRSPSEGCALRTTPEYSEKLRVAKLGELNSSVKLAEPDVLAIRDIYDNAIKVGEPKVRTETSLAKQYGVGRSTISDIVKRRTWKHI